MGPLSAARIPQAIVETASSGVVRGSWRPGLPALGVSIQMARMRRCAVEVSCGDPLAGRGYAAQVAPQVARELEALGVDHEMVWTRYAGEAVDLAAGRRGGLRRRHGRGRGWHHARGESTGWWPTASVAKIAIWAACQQARRQRLCADEQGDYRSAAEDCRSLTNGSVRTLDVGQVTVRSGTVMRYSTALALRLTARARPSACGAAFACCRWVSNGYAATP